MLFQHHKKRKRDTFHEQVHPNKQKTTKTTTKNNKIRPQTGGYISK